MKLKLVVILVFVFNCVLAQQIDVVPMPADVRLTKNFITLKTPAFIVSNGKIESGDGGVDNFRQFLKDKYKLTTVKTNSRSSAITEFFLNYVPEYPSESYSIEIKKPNNIKITGNANGIFYAFQTLKQLFTVDKNSLKLPIGIIKDSARFPYRGMHLDVARHFFNVAQVKKYIDYLAEHKFNTFHWHLTEDQGWRIEIKKYPLLTKIGGCRAQTLVGRFGTDKYDNTPYCAFYTQEEIKEVVRYATERYITVIPEIDMPGHMLSAMAAYPFLGCTKGPYKVMETWGVQPDILCGGNDSTYVFIQDVLDEVLRLFPSKYIHIGGDEAPKERWKACPVCQARIKKEGLKDEHELQSYFITRVEKYLNSKGRNIIGWDEILEGGLAPNATVMSWRGIRGGIAAAKMGHNVIMTPENPLYINHSQSRNEDSITQGQYNPIEAIYAYDPVPAELTDSEKKYILGGQGNMWSEYISNWPKLEYMLFPRMSALSEVLWTPANKKNWSDFERRLPVLFKRYRAAGINYSNAFFDLQPSVVSVNNGIAWKLDTRNKSGKIIFVRGRETSASFPYQGPVEISQSGEYGAALTDSSHRIISSWVWQKFNFNKATGKKITLTTAPNQSYSVGGPFTLVDGVQNEMGMMKSAQFLGFLGKDLEAIIDLGTEQDVQSIKLHAFEQQPSWIYRPASVAFFTSNDGINFIETKTPAQTGSKNLLYSAAVSTKARYIKIIAKNYGKIPAGSPGAGTNAWLFADEVEVQ